jgi:hypothetical protein
MSGYREKKEGPIRLVYAGSEHVGNIIEPTFGGNKQRAQSFKAISKHWGRTTSHPSKHAAMTWLQSRHGATMKLEQTADLDSTHDVLRDNGWKRAHAYGFKHHLAASQKATYTHDDLPGHKIHASYTNGTWQHEHPKQSHARVGMGARSLHGLVNKLHSSKTIDAVREFVQHVKEEHPDDWREAIFVLLREKNEPVEQKIEESPEDSVQGSTPRTTMLKSIKASKVSIVKRNPSLAVTQPTSQNTIGENSGQPGKYASADMPFDKEKNEKDPKAGPQSTPSKKDLEKGGKKNDDDKQGPKPVPTEDAEGEVTIKRTMTGEPGATIEINPMMKRTPTGDTKYSPSPEAKKKPDA